MGILGKPYFRGQSIHRLDSKGRLRIPSKFREVLQNHYTEALIITRMGDCLVAYPPEIWDKIESKPAVFRSIANQGRFMRISIECGGCELDN